MTQEAAGSESPEPPPPPPPKSPQRHKASRRLPRDDAAEEVFEKVKTLRGMPALSSGIFDILRDEPPPPPPPPPVRPRSQRSGMGIATPPRAPEKERRRFGPTRTSLGIPQQPPPPPPQPPPQPPPPPDPAPFPRTRTRLGIPRQPPPKPPPPQRPAKHAETITCGVSEFGIVLAELLERFTEIRGAVLTDDEGNPVDFARRPTAIDTLDLQIVGAQLERCIAPVDASCAKLGLSTRADVVILEGDEGTILGCTLVEGMFVLAAIVAPTENIERLSATFDDVARKLTMLLES